MNVGQIIAQIRQLAGDPSGTQYTPTVLASWIDNGIKECVIQNSLCQKTASTVTVPGQTDYNLPTDIFKLHSVNVDGDKIKVWTLDEWEARNNGPGALEETGRSFQAYVWANKLVLTPSPDAEYALKINYIYEPAAIDPDDENDDLPIPPAYHMRLVVFALAQVALQDEDMFKYQNLMQQFNSGVIDLKNQINTEEDQYPFISVSTRDAGEEFFPW